MMVDQVTPYERGYDAAEGDQNPFYDPRDKCEWEFGRLARELEMSRDEALDVKFPPRKPQPPKCQQLREDQDPRGGFWPSCGWLLAVYAAFIILLHIALHIALIWG